MNTNTEVLLYNAARSQSLQVIKNSVEQGLVCVVDRNYLTTLAIQYYGRGDVPDYETINRIIEFAVNGVEPDLCIVMDAPVNALKERAGHRGQGERFDNLDEAFLERVRAGYLWEAKQRNLPIVYAVDDEQSVADNIWKLVAEVLAVRDSSAATSKPEPIKDILDKKKQSAAPVEPPSEALMRSADPDSAAQDAPLVEKKDGRTIMTAAGREYLASAVTSVDGNVYGFYDKLTPVTIAAAMARLSRRADDMRITILDEFAGKVDKDAQLLQRVITAYGDDSVQQLGGIHMVFENASGLLAKKVEWGRLAGYLEQSTRYIYFDQKDAEGNYRYVVPKNLKPAVKKKYREITDQIFDRYSEIVHALTKYVTDNSDTPEKERDGAWKQAVRAQACDAARAVLPLSIKATIGMFASGQAIESLVMHLLSDELLEARDAGQEMLEEARKIIPMYLERADKPERGGATIAYRANTHKAMKELAQERLTENYGAADAEPITLIDYWPKNELALAADMLYEHSGLPLEQIRETVNGWSYDQKQEVLKTYIGERLNRRHKPGRALEKAHYSWDLVSEFAVFKDLQRHRMVDDLEWQALTPRYGYDIPKLVEDAGLTDKFEECFDLSLKLYSLLQETGHALEAQYATLQGHKMRWKITYNAREAFHLHELRTSPQGHPAYRKFVKEMHEKVAEVHPILAEAMKFVNQGEDDTLTRLAAERYTQYKLEQLGGAPEKSSK
jgi:thymidylate synthase ThyX/thymidylate kinase